MHIILSNNLYLRKEIYLVQKVISSIFARKKLRYFKMWCCKLVTALKNDYIGKALTPSLFFVAVFLGFLSGISFYGDSLFFHLFDFFTYLLVCIFMFSSFIYITNYSFIYLSVNFIH